MEVTLDAAPTTPEITFRTCVLLQWYSASSMLLMDPETLTRVSTQRRITKRRYRTNTFKWKTILFNSRKHLYYRSKEGSGTVCLEKLFEVQCDTSVAVKLSLTKRGWEYFQLYGSSVEMYKWLLFPQVNLLEPRLRWEVRHRFDPRLETRPWRLLTQSLGWRE